MGSISPVLTREQKRKIASGELTDAQIERMRNSAKAWKIEIPTGRDKDGKRLRYTETFHGGKREAKRRQEELDAYYGTKNIKDRTLKAYVEEYLARKKGTVSDSTHEAIRRKLDVILYMFGENTRLSKITPAMIDDTFLEMISKGAKRGKPCKPSYVSCIKATMGTLMRDAIRHGALAHDPMLLSESSFKRKAERRDIPPMDELTRVMRKLDVRDNRHMAIMLALCLGLRRQECLGLRFDDCDMDSKTIHVHRSVREARGREWVEEVTKTEAGMRDIPMPPYMPELLEKRKATLLGDIEVALRAGEIEEAPKELYVCANRYGERPTLTSITAYWCNRREGFGVTCAFHDLRHAFCSALAAADPPIHVSTAQRLSGHADARTLLNTYTHVSYDSVVTAIENVSKLYEDGLVEIELDQEKPADV